MAYSRDDLMELAPLHALGATTPDEADALEAAMRSDDALRREVAAHRDVTAALAATAPLAPSPVVRGRLLAAVRRDRRLPRWAPLAFAASLLAAIGLGGYAMQLRARLGEREALLDTVLEAERSLVVAHLAGDAGATGPGIQFFWNARQGRALAHVFRLPPAPPGRAYQIWAIVNGAPVSLTVFNSDPDGHALVEHFTLPAATTGVSAIAVTLEPAGGSSQPTTTPFLVGTVGGG